MGDTPSGHRSTPGILWPPICWPQAWIKLWLLPLLRASEIVRCCLRCRGVVDSAAGVEGVVHAQLGVGGALVEQPRQASAAGRLRSDQLPSIGCRHRPARCARGEAATVRKQILKQTFGKPNHNVATTTKTTQPSEHEATHAVQRRSKTELLGWPEAKLKLVLRELPRQCHGAHFSGDSRRCVGYLSRNSQGLPERSFRTPSGVQRVVESTYCGWR